MKNASNTRISTACAKALPIRLRILPQTTTIVAVPAILQIFAYCRGNYEPPQEAFDRLSELHLCFEKTVDTPYLQDNSCGYVKIHEGQAGPQAASWLIG